MSINKVSMENSRAHSFLCLQLLLCNQAELGNCKGARTARKAGNIHCPDLIGNICRLRIKPKVSGSDGVSGVHDGNRRENEDHTNELGGWQR